jgi:hypothetical protein
MMAQSRAILERVAKRLLEAETISGEELRALMAGT